MGNQCSRKGDNMKKRTKVFLICCAILSIVLEVIGSCFQVVFLCAIAGVIMAICICYWIQHRDGWQLRKAQGHVNTSLCSFHKKFTKKLAIGVDNC